MGATERAEAKRLLQSSDFPTATPEQLQSAADLMLAAGVGGIVGGVAAGPVGVVTGIVTGIAGEKAAQTVEAKVGGKRGALAGAGAGLATDAALTLLLNRGKPSGGLLRRVEELRPKVRAGKMLSEAGLTQIGPEGATELGELVVRGYDALEQAEKAAWDAARQSASAVEVSSAPVKKAARDVLQRMRLEPEKSQAAQLILGKDSLGKPNIGDKMEIEEARAVLSSVSEDLRLAAIKPELKRRGVGAAELRAATNQVLDDIGRQAPDAVDALRAARTASAKKHAAIPERSVLYKVLVGEGAMDQPEKAFQTILSSRQPVQEIRRVRKLLAASSPADQAMAERALKRIAISEFFGRVSGATGEIAPRSTGAAAARGEARSAVLREILGRKGFERIQKINRELYESTRGKRRKLLPEVLTRQSPGQGGGIVTTETGLGGVVGAALGYGLGGPQGAAAGALAVGGSVKALRSIAERIGPIATRSLAIEALLDPDVMKIITKARTDSRAVTSAIETLARRGILDWREVTGSDAPAGRPVRIEEE